METIKFNILETQLKEVFKEFHKNPELSNEEFKTTESIKKLLNDANIEILDLELKTGVVGIIRGKNKGKTIAIRSDIDGLPIEEEADVEYKSNVKGKMHACGHDFHIVSVLGAAYILKSLEDELSGNIKIIFQPAEETGHGAKEIINSKVLEDVEFIFGLHNSNELDVGEFGTSEGSITAAVDRFEIKLQGVGSHGASPEKGNDPIIALANIVLAVQSILGRNIASAERAVISITNISAGNTWNVIPESGYIEGTVRTFNSEVRNLIRNRFLDISYGIEKTYGVLTKLVWHEGPPAVNNDSELTRIASNIARNEGFKVHELLPTMGGEDFAYYQKKIRGAFVVIGTGKSYPHHHPKFKVDDNALLGAAKYMAKLASDVLEK